MDKQLIKELPKIIFPGATAPMEPPSVNILAFLGMENLIRIQCVHRRKISSSRVVVPARKQERCAYWRQYESNLLRALLQADSKPIFPDLRTQNWAKPAETILATCADYSGDKKTRSFVFATVSNVQLPPKISDKSCTIDRLVEESGNINLHCEVDPTVWSSGSVDYNLNSACLMRQEDLRFFLNDPDFLEVWLEFKGIFDPKERLDDETKIAIKRQVMNLVGNPLILE